ncbi:hypothetical protein Thivi_0960 [Thiocystis violascens DSM 198]|uniref:Uncharacterized protein n=1 Tax=Thiocystis violascens (strain ATCC 17096 / DSM 198 / 6111) TaxID=765911 RepID=I3Y7M7_THIV6|nr:hypothetical protein Thivi_0960 [Thiocystis violascens DSM 198]
MKPFMVRRSPRLKPFVVRHSPRLKPFMVRHLPRLKPFVVRHSNHEWLHAPSPSSRMASRLLYVAHSQPAPEFQKGHGKGITRIGGVLDSSHLVPLRRIPVRKQGIAVDPDMD